MHIFPNCQHMLILEISHISYVIYMIELLQDVLSSSFCASETWSSSNVDRTHCKLCNNLARKVCRAISVEFSVSRLWVSGSLPSSLFDLSSITFRTYWKLSLKHIRHQNLIKTLQNSWIYHVLTGNIFFLIYAYFK